MTELAILTDQGWSSSVFPEAGETWHLKSTAAEDTRSNRKIFLLWSIPPNLNETTQGDV
jgi:hypothetical protein